VLLRERLLWFDRKPCFFSVDLRFFTLTSALFVVISAFSSEKANFSAVKAAISDVKAAISVEIAAENGIISNATTWKSSVLGRKSCFSPRQSEDHERTLHLFPCGVGGVRLTRE
jgi:hypothetical protein